MKDLLLIGLSHKTAPVALRERFQATDLSEALHSLRGIAGEAALLSTCNRFEIYLGGGADRSGAVEWLCRRGDIREEELRPHLSIREGRNACKHLFFVASSLDSLVVGETQIRGQVKRAYEAAQEAETVGALFHQLFRSALRVSKEIADRTGITRGNVSVAGAAADLAERVFGDLSDAQLLIIGAGETAELLLTHMQARGVTRCQIANRTRNHAEELAARFQGTAISLEELDAYLAAADVIACAAGGDPPLLGLDLMRGALRRRRGKPVVLLDIAVPRGSDAATGELDNVYRYDMDDLTAVTQDALRHRRSEFLQCCTLIDAATLRLDAEWRSHGAGPAIAELERHFTRLAHQELEQTLRRPGLATVPRDELERLVHRIVRKLLHQPVRALKETPPEESEIIRRVFFPPDEDPS